MTERLVYKNHEALISLAATAAVADRVRLQSTVLIGPVRDASLMAKQAATIDALSEAIEGLIQAFRALPTLAPTN